MTEETTKKLNIFDLTTKRETKICTVTVEKGEFDFTYRDLDWYTRMTLAGQYMEAIDGVMKFDAVNYYIDALMAMVDEDTHPEITPTVLKTLSPAVLDQLVGIVPSPVWQYDGNAELKKRVESGEDMMAPVYQVEMILRFIGYSSKEIQVMGIGAYHRSLIFKEMVSSIILDVVNKAFSGISPPSSSDGETFTLNNAAPGFKLENPFK